MPPLTSPAVQKRVIVSHTVSCTCYPPPSHLTLLFSSTPIPHPVEFRFVQSNTRQATCIIFNFLVDTFFKKQKETGEVHVYHLFNLAQYIQNISISICHQYKNISEIFLHFFFLCCLQNLVCTFSPCRLVSVLFQTSCILSAQQPRVASGSQIRQVWRHTAFHIGAIQGPLLCALVSPPHSRPRAISIPPLVSTTIAELSNLFYFQNLPLPTGVPRPL